MAILSMLLVFPIKQFRDAAIYTSKGHNARKDYRAVCARTK